MNESIQELEETNLILKIPKETIQITLSCVLLDEDGKTFTAQKTLRVSDIFEARRAFLENVELGDDYEDARYVITDKGLEYLNALEERRQNDLFETHI